MQIPTRKPGKYSWFKPDPYLTESKIQELKNKLDKLKNSRPALAEEVRRLADMGDFSENFAYQAAKGRLRWVNQKILDIEDHLKKAVIICNNKINNLVELGNKVLVEFNGKTKTYLILGSSETDPANGVISHNSPIGAGLLNHKTGDVVKIRLAEKDVEYKILKIE